LDADAGWNIECFHKIEMSSTNGITLMEVI